MREIYFDGMTIFDNYQFFIHTNKFGGNRPETARAHRPRPILIQVLQLQI